MAVETLLRYDAFAWHYEGSIGDRSVDDDLTWYARRGRGPILELACGTGRVALSLARAGLRVLGLDLSEPMLRIARRKAQLGGLEKQTAFIRRLGKRSYQNKVYNFPILAARRTATVRARRRWGAIV
jgi:SAM-dependent methyltransferase